MKVGKILLVFCVVLILGVFVGSQCVHAFQFAEKLEKPASAQSARKDDVDKEFPEKGSQLSALRSLANIEQARDGDIITEAEYNDYVDNGLMTKATFFKLREFAGDWSETTADREISDLKLTGIMKEAQVGGKYSFTVQLSPDQFLNLAQIDDGAPATNLNKGTIDNADLEGIKAAIATVIAESVDVATLAGVSTAARVDGSTIEIETVFTSSEIRTVSIPVALAENNPAQANTIIDMAIGSGKHVALFKAPEERQNITDLRILERIRLEQISIIDVAANSPAGIQLARAFEKSQLIGVIDSLDEIRKAIRLTQVLN